MNTFFRILVAGSALALASCSSSKPKGKSTKALPKVTGSAPSGASSARPVNHLSRSEYPFDSSGNYITSWVTSGSSSSSRSTSYSKPKVVKKTYTAKPAPAPRPKPKPTYTATPKPKYTPPVRKPVGRYISCGRATPSTASADATGNLYQRSSRQTASEAPQFAAASGYGFRSGTL